MAMLSFRLRRLGEVIFIFMGTEIGENIEFYAEIKRFDHDPRGLGAILTVGCEVYRLMED